MTSPTEFADAARLRLHSTHDSLRMRISNWSNRLALVIGSFVLRNPTGACSIVRDAKEDILAKDWILTLQDSRSHPSLAVVSATDWIASSWNSHHDNGLFQLIGIHTHGGVNLDLPPRKPNFRLEPDSILQESS